MFFDEEKRKKLIAAYRALPEDERAAYRLFSVICIPVSATVLTAILNASGLSLPVSEKKFSRASRWNQQRDVVSMLERWLLAELTEKSLASKGEGWKSVSLVAEIAVRESLDTGEFDSFDTAAGSVLNLSRNDRLNRYDSTSAYFRALRKAVYCGDVHGYEKLMLAEVSDKSGSRGSDPKEEALIDILANPLEKERLFSLPSRMGLDAFELLLKASLDDAAFFLEILDLFEAYRRKNPGDDLLDMAWIEYALFAGRVKEAVQAAGRTNTAEKYAVLAFGALIDGERDRALVLYEEGLRLLRKNTGKRKAAFFSWTGIFYPILLLNDADSARKIADYAEAARLYGNTLLFDVYGMMRTWSGGKEPEVFNENSEELRPERCVSAFFELLFAYWLDRSKARELRPLVDLVRLHLKERHFILLETELTSLAHEIWPESEEYGGLNSLMSSHSLKNLAGSQAGWERSLDALSGIVSRGGVTAGKGAKRFVWEISWISKDRTPSRISLTPVEQTLQSSGWSKGKNIALRRLYRKADAVPGMTDQDRRAVSAIREARGYYGTEYYVDVPQALDALAGHPYLFREEDGGRVEVVADEPQLLTTSDGENYHLRLFPFPEDGDVPQHIVREDGPNCLRVTRFGERHLKMAEILGKNGIFVPFKARNALLKALGSLASVVTIHSDIDGVESGAEQIRADSRIYVQIQASDEGLDVDMLVRPLGSDGPPCRPGVGGNNIFGLQDGKRVQARRELEEEKDALMLTVRSCPALMDASQIADERWQLHDPALALEFLMQVQDLGNSVVAEWPKGQTMSVRAQVSADSMSISVRSFQDWFALSGSLEIDEQLVLSMKDLLELLKSGHGRFLPLGDGQFVALSKEFRHRLEALSALGSPKGNELQVPLLSAGLLAPLVDGAASFEGNAEWRRQLKRIDEARALRPVLPSTFKGELRSYQLEGYQWLARLAYWGGGACLADDMGLGKTVQTLALLASRGERGPSLVIAPTSVCSNWITEAKRFTPTLKVKELRCADRERTLKDLTAFDVVVATYGLLQNEVESLSAIQWNTIVLDEAQAIKNMGTKRSVAAMKLSGEFRMATTGTPIENRLTELWNIFRFLNPHYLGSLESFNRRFAVPIERDGDREARLRLKRIIQPFILRRNKEQVLEELPPKTEITLKVDLKDAERAFYEALRRDAVKNLGNVGEIDSSRRLKIFAELMRLRRACCNTALVAPEMTGKEFPSAKMEAFVEILTELRENKHKALVFSQFVGHLALIRNYLDEEGIRYQYLDGATPPQERVKRIAAFQAGEGDCFLISLKAGGTGLNLTAADYVIHMDPWWNPAVEEQASDRAHRIGQERPVTVYRVVAKDTIEEKIVDLHAWKRDLAESLLDESGTPLRLSTEDLLELIQDTE